MILKVALVDDEQIILNGLQSVIDWKSFGCEVVGTAADGRSGLDLVRNMKPDILLTDIRMPNMDGIAMIAALKSEFPAMQITVLTAFRDFDYAKRAIHLGVCRYLLKPSRMDELHEAVATMAHNMAMLTPLQRAQPIAPPLADGHAPAGLGVQPLLDPQLAGEDADMDSEAGSFVARAALRYIQEHCTEHLSLSDVAENVYVSQWHLSKLINRHAQQSFFDLLNHYRVQRSQAMLADPMFKVNEIAYAIGYADVAHFSRIFKKLTGQTPMEYRSSLR